MNQPKENGEMMMNSRPRKEQIEKDFGRELRRVLKAEGIGYFNRAQSKAIREALRDAAMVGACEERHRALMAIKDDPNRAAEVIVSKSVLEALGYE